MIRRLNLENLSIMICWLFMLVFIIIGLMNDPIPEWYILMLVLGWLFPIFVTFFPESYRKKPFKWKPKFKRGDKVLYFNEEFIVTRANYDYTYDIKYVDHERSNSTDDHLYDIDEKCLDDMSSL